uniref:Uncharacterized protein n=1 Tax=Opuntia streptacantha TaxID=393608 RepID=A0A7C9ATQ0_OPUST
MKTSSCTTFSRCACFFPPLPMPVSLDCLLNLVMLACSLKDTIDTDEDLPPHQNRVPRPPPISVNGNSMLGSSGPQSHSTGRHGAPDPSSRKGNRLFCSSSIQGSI